VNSLNLVKIDVDSFEESILPGILFPTEFLSHGLPQNKTKQFIHNFWTNQEKKKIFGQKRLQ